MTIGIYSLYWEVSDLIYIGQSSNIENRFYEHRRLFENNSGSSKKLAKAYKEFGHPEYNILLECSLEELDYKEEELIAEFDSVVNGLNTISSIFGVGKDTQHAGSKYTENQIIEALEFACSNPNIKQKDLPHLSKAVFSSIICGKRHKWVEERYPELWNKLQIIRNNRKSIDYFIDNPKELVHVDGTIERIINISKFAKQYNLSTPHISEVLSKHRLSHKGWKLLTN